MLVGRGCLDAFGSDQQKLVTTQYVTQLVPYVKGQVTAVHAQANQPMKKGDLLLEIEPAPYQYAVNQVQAALEQAKAAVANAKATLTRQWRRTISPRRRKKSP